MTAEIANSALDSRKIFYNRFLLIVAGLGGLLYGVDVGIIAGALPYLEATSGLNAGQLSIVVAAVLLGSVISTLFAGLLADWMGRKWLMALSGVMFVFSIPTIALAHGYGPLVFGRLLQGVSAGLIGVVVPLYLAECLEAFKPGQGYVTLRIPLSHYLLIQLTLFVLTYDTISKHAVISIGTQISKLILFISYLNNIISWNIHQSNDSFSMCMVILYLKTSKSSFWRMISSTFI